MKVTVFTSITLNYLPKARVLARSVKKVHPEVHFCLVLAEPAPPDLREVEPAFDEVLTPADFPLSGREGWIFQHRLVEICTALKGYALTLLLNRGETGAVVYLDPDIAVFHPLEPVWTMLADHDVVLTPHLCEPERSLAGIADHEICALRHGVYNLGFLAVANRAEGRRFAAWWCDRLAAFCFSDFEQGLFTDQRWIDLAPAFFPSTGILRHPGCNVATWNLSHRRVEGDFEAGFQVNGLPLIFYHFSGFDSGVQLVMLRCYAADQPAAFRLRNWYVEETARMDARGYHRHRWAYDTFDNGEPVHPSYRLRYRQEPALAARFPHPLATHGDSYWRWLDEQGLRVPPPSPASEPTPLQRYLEDASLFPISPHPLFDGEGYLRDNPDVAAAGCNPLLHYVAWGEAENRAPHPDIEVPSLRAALTRAGLPPAQPLVAYERTGRSWRAHPRFDARYDGETLARLRAYLHPDRPTLLSITHCGSGGTGNSVERKMCVLNDRTNGLLITSLPSGRSVLRLPFEPGAPELIFDRRSRPGDRAAVMRALGVERLHIHHAVYNETWLDAFVRELGLPYDITLHDYYFLAPQAHLLDETGRFVGDERLDDEVLARPFWSNAEPVSLRIWRTRAHRLLVGAQRRLAPSHDLARRFLRIYPDLAIQVVPHHEMPRPETHPVSLTPCAPEEPVRVLLLGALGVNKGSTILRACAELARQSGAPLDFHVLGALDINPPPGVTVHGLYEMDQLPACIARIAPHLAWFPVQGPESYSYTLSEAMQAGLPILASALGSFPERLAGRAWSWLHPWKASPENWLERLLEIRTRHLIGRAPAAAPGNPPAWDTTFYPDRYMEGL